MPALDYEALAGEADPPIVEQIISPNALRQRRFRERQKTLRNADVTPKAALPNATDGAESDEADQPRPGQATEQCGADLDSFNTEAMRPGYDGGATGDTKS